MKSERLRDSEDKLRRLAAHLISVREEERAHIAREIHDELGQVLTASRWRSAGCRSASGSRSSSKNRVDVEADRLHGADGAQDRTGLRPEMLDDMAWSPRSGWQAKEFQKRTGIRCRTKLRRRGKLAWRSRPCVFRIFQEILTNIARHARATRVDIELGVSGERIELDVLDNGIGIPDAELNGRKSLGLLACRSGRCSSAAK